MSRLYLQKGGIDHFIDKGVQLDNKSYTPMSLDGGGEYELPNAFFTPDNELLFIKEISSARLSEPPLPEPFPATVSLDPRTCAVTLFVDKTL